MAPLPTRLFPRQPPNLTLARVSHVLDGRTIEVVVEGRRRVEVTFAGADVPVAVPGSPEPCGARPALEWLFGALEGRSIALERDPLTPDRDKQGRWIRYVWLAESWRDDNVLVDLALVRQGLARRATQRLYAYHPKILPAEEEARAAGRGVWSCRP
jgi:endonuclease YncB( thermonuclease family)